MVSVSPTQPEPVDTTPAMSAASTLFELGAGDLQTLLTTGAVTTADVVDSCLRRIADRGTDAPTHPSPSRGWQCRAHPGCRRIPRGTADPPYRPLLIVH